MQVVVLQNKAVVDRRIDLGLLSESPTLEVHLLSLQQEPISTALRKQEVLLATRRIRLGSNRGQWLKATTNRWTSSRTKGNACSSLKSGPLP